MRTLSNNILKKLAAVLIACAIVLPVTATAAQAVTGWYYGDSGISWNFKQRWAWSQFTTSSIHDGRTLHGSSVYGNIDGLKRSSCVNLGERAYSQSKYSAFGGNYKPYYRWC